MEGSKDYLDFIGSLKDQIRNAQYEALTAVNKKLVGLYWDIGKMISEKQKKSGWGKSIVQNISNDLAQEFPKGGFSVSNLWYMTQFYQEYRGHSILEPLVREIGWTHNLVIFKKCKDTNSRVFYIKYTKKFGWSKRVLEHQIDNKTHEKYLLDQTNYDIQSTEGFNQQRKLAIKDHYTFDFLELSEKHSERELESALIRNIQSFLQEIGGELAFIGNQFRLEVGGDEFFVDLLLFHRELHAWLMLNTHSKIRIIKLVWPAILPGLNFQPIM